MYMLYSSLLVQLYLYMYTVLDSKTGGLDGGAEREISEAGSRPQQVLDLVASLKLSLSAPPSKPV
jgi:hypothetical protein